MKAQEAKLRAEAVLTNMEIDNYSKIINTIKKAVNEGRFSCNFYGNILPTNYNILIKNGYKIIKGIQDPKDSDPTYEIYW